MKVSLVTPVKDEETTIEELIEGVAAQTRPADEWIVVDGGSRDRTVEILEASDGCVVLSAPGNISSGRNAGIRAASGEVIATIDAGCRPRPDWLERLVAPLEAGTAQVVAGSTRARIETPFDAAQAALLDQFVLDDSGASLRRAALSARCLAFRREVWQRESFPEWLDHGEDAWLLGQWSRAGASALRVPDAEVEWRQRSSLADFAKQHFRYMRGDGRAGMNPSRHALRWGFYLFLGIVAVLAAQDPRLGSMAVVAWMAYAAISALRLAAKPERATIGFRLRSLVVLLVLLPIMDASKMAGYAAGWVDRLRGGRQGE